MGVDEKGVDRLNFTAPNASERDASEIEHGASVRDAGDPDRRAAMPEMVLGESMLNLPPGGGTLQPKDKVVSHQ